MEGEASRPGHRRRGDLQRERTGVLKQPKAPSDGIRHKNQDSFPKIPAEGKLLGSLHAERKRCGKENCRCTSGREEDLHGPYYYRRWRDEEGNQREECVPRSDVKDVQAKCAGATLSGWSGWERLNIYGFRRRESCHTYAFTRAMSLHQARRLVSGLTPRYLKQGIKYLCDEDFREEKRREWEIRRLQDLPRRKTATTDLLGHPLEITDAKTFVPAYHSIFEEEAYSFRPRQEPPVIIDGGANVGLATLYWKRQFPEAQITAFEPGPQVFQALKNNIERFGLENVELLQKGLWKEEGSLTFEADRASSGHFSRYPAEDTVETVEVPVTRLSPHLNERRVDMVKLDIEGAEIEVLLEAASELDQVDHLVVEYHSYPGKEQRLDELLTLLREAGFRVHIQPERVAEKPFIETPIHKGMDHNLNVFAYRR